MKKDAWFLLIAVAGFAVFAVDIRFEHREVLAEHPVAWVPIVYCLLAVGACLFGLADRAAWKIPLMVFFGLGIGVGMFGVKEHLEDQEQVPGMIASTLIGREVSGRRVEKPLIAPMGVSGLSLLALVAVTGGSRGRSRKKDSD
ncbi:MAG: hypothetical protein MH204_11420 [Fimbriimonadaceae bacterium]|nr:hypothetical protein [Fimbriimonadaceae bacterium]